MVSQFVKSYFHNFFSNFDNENLNNHNENDILKIFQDKNVIKEQIKLIEKFLLEKSYSIQYSGTTCLIIIYIKDKIICYNIGDSRAIYINNELKCFQISQDHKPEIYSEKMRIEENGGIVKKDYLNIGAYRVWSKNGNYPGLAMSRSIGDYVAKSIGVTNEPDFFEIDIIKNNVIGVIISTDGLWNILKNSEIEKIVEEYIIKKDSIGCVNTLIDEANKKYKKKNIFCDDITVIVIFFELKK